MPLLFDQISKTAELLTNRGVVQQVSTSLSPNKSLIYNKWLKCSVTFFQPLCITLLLFAFLSPPKGISNELLYISMRFDSTLYGREGGIVRCYQVFSSVRRMTRVNLEENHMLVKTDKPCSCKLCIFNLGFPAVFRPGLEFNPCSCEEAHRGGFWKNFLSRFSQFMGDLVNAIRDYQAAVKTDPSYALAYYNAANVYFRQRQFKQVSEIFISSNFSCAFTWKVKILIQL